MSRQELVLFDFDGVLATPVFTKEDGRILPGKNVFIDNFTPYLLGRNPYIEQKPISSMQQIIAKIAPIYDIGILSTCGIGDVEAVAKRIF